MSVLRKTNNNGKQAPECLDDETKRYAPGVTSQNSVTLLPRFLMLVLPTALLFYVLSSIFHLLCTSEALWRSAEACSAVHHLIAWSTPSCKLQASARNLHSAGPNGNGDLQIGDAPPQQAGAINLAFPDFLLI